MSMQILTPNGFQPFDGVKRYHHDKCIQFVFDDGSTLKTAYEHRFIIDGVEVFSKDIDSGTNIGKTIVDIKELFEPQFFYDPVNVANGSIYCHDKNLVSHNTFHGTGNTLISGDTLLNLRAAVPEYMQNSIKVFEKPLEDHAYMISVDVAKGRGMDYSAFSIIDISQKPFKQVAAYRDNKISPLLLPDVIWKYAKAFNNAYVFIESNDQGAMVANGLYYELEYENVFVESVVKANSIGINMNKKVKRIGCSQLKDLIEENKLTIVDPDTIIELSTFEARGTSYEARDGCHDDTVMALVLFGYVTSLPFFNELTDKNIKTFIYQENIKMIEDELVPFGFIDNGGADEIEIVDGEVWRTVGRDKDLFKIWE